MNDNIRATADRDTVLENFAAELTRAAYHVFLLHQSAGTWLDVQLELWRALADTVKEWDGPPTPGYAPHGVRGRYQEVIS